MTTSAPSTAVPLQHRLDQLEACRRRHGPGEAEFVLQLLATFGGDQHPNPESLIRYHDALLFLRAFPQAPAVARRADELLAGCGREVARLRAAGADMSLFDPEEVSGIAGTELTDSFTYEVAEWLLHRHGKDVAADWDLEEQSPRLGAALPRFLPLLEEDSLVEADVPYLDWLRAACPGGDREHQWLLRRVARLPLPPSQKTELYDALGVTLRWSLGESPASRTRARWPARRLFCHTEPLIQRKQVSLERELASPPLPVRRLSRRNGERVLDMVRDALTVRYRELYGTTRGDPASVIQASPGRGAEIFLWGLPPDRRLPLRAYHAGITIKNGVPINYIEGISLFDWIEVGFNTFYAFRDGESAWIYAKVLRLFRQLLGVSCVSVYPYQIGLGNEEAIKAGAFWFYRKLGFRPGRPELLRITRREERRLAANPAYRTSARTLRRLAAGHIFHELPDATPGAWDRFSLRNLGLAVQRHMAEHFGDDLERMLALARARLARALGVNLGRWSAPARTVFDNVAMVLALVPDLSRWNTAEKRTLMAIIRAKLAPDEAAYLRLLQRHARLKAALLALGARGKVGGTGLPRGRLEQ